MSNKSALDYVNELLEIAKKKQSTSEAKTLASTLLKSLTDLKKVQSEVMKKSEEMEKVDPQSHLPSILIQKDEGNARAMSDLAKRIKKCMLQKKDNPDLKADAELGEKVEADVESHMLANKDAEKKEGHKIFNEEMEKNSGHPAADANMNIKGVHEIAPTYKRPGTDHNKYGKVSHGSSLAAMSSNPKKEHKKVLNDLKAQPKPNLPKSEK